MRTLNLTSYMFPIRILVLYSCFFLMVLSGFSQKKDLLEGDLILQQYTGATYCDQPMSEMDFETIRVGIEALPRQELRFEKIRMTFCGECLLTPYVLQLMQLFEDPAYEYDVMRWAYYYTYDLGNYRNLLPFMEGLVFQDRMESYLNERQNAQRSDIEGRRQLMVDSELQTVLTELNKQSAEQMRLVVAKEIVRSNNLLSEQFAQMVQQFDLRKNQIELIQYGYDKVYDPANYFVVYELLRGANVRKVQTYIASQPQRKEDAYTSTRELGCFYVDARGEFEGHLRSIQSKSYAKDRIRFARSVFGEYCFNTRELIECVKLFPSDADRLTLVTDAYSDIYDPWNYYLVFSHLRSQNSINELAAVLVGR